MEVKEDAVVTGNVRGHRQLDTGFNELRRRFAAIVNHADRNLVTHEHQGFGVVEGRNLRAGKHFGRSVAHQVGNGQLEMVIQNARRNGSRSIGNSRSHALVREGLDCSTRPGRTDIGTCRRTGDTRSQSRRAHRCRPVDTEFTSQFAVYDNELRSNHDLQGFDIKLVKRMGHLLDAGFGIVHDDGVGTFDHSNAATARLHAFEHLDQFVRFGMVHLEVLTDKRSVLLGLAFFFSNLFLLRLVSRKSLDRDVLVLNEPSQIVQFADNVEGFLPGLLCHLEAHLALHIGSNQDVHTGNHGYGAEHGLVVHIDKVEIIQFLVGSHRPLGRGSPSSHAHTCRQKKNRQYFRQFFHF